MNNSNDTETIIDRNRIKTLIHLDDPNERIDVLLQPFFKEGTEILSFNKIDEIYSIGPNDIIYYTDKKLDYTEEELKDDNTDYYTVFDLMIDRWGCTDDVQYGEYYDSNEEILDKTAEIVAEYIKFLDENC
jgi:hypothetical protein